MIRCTDGKREKLPIVIDKNIGDWWSDWKEGEEAGTAWVKVNNSVESKVNSIEATVPGNGPTVTVVGITGAKW
jgi:hypothetical protein